jgi:predicted phosphodiesterase
MLKLSHCFDVWRKAADDLISGNSVLFYAPRHYHTRRFAGEILKKVADATGGVSVRLHIDHHVVAGGKLDYARIWEATRKRTASANHQRVDNRDAYDLALRKAAKKWTGPTVFYVTCEYGFEVYESDILGLLHQIDDEMDLDESHWVCFLALDNYSLYYYEFGRSEHSSTWDIGRHHHYALGEAEIIGLLKSQELDRWVPKDAAENAGKAIFRLTGGHVGLVLDILDYLSLQPEPVRENFCENEYEYMLRRSNIVEDIRRSLEEDPRGLTEVALAYKTPRYPMDTGRPDVQFLRQLGVIQWTSGLRAELCPGLISDLVHQLRPSFTETRSVGTMLSEFGPRLYDPRSEQVLADDADFVVVHLSDIHVGLDYPYKLPEPVPGRQEQGKKSLAQLLSNDLMSLGLKGRLDAVILSGDFTQTASIDEFRSARRVVSEILTEIGAEAVPLAITPGNHDVVWDPTSGMARVEALSGASRENYETFRELMKLDGASAVDLRCVVSRSGKALLQIISLDSNFVEGPKAAGIGYVNDDCFVRAEALLADEANKRARYQREYEVVRTWVVVHHHVFPASPLTLEEIQRKKLTVLANSSDVLAFANRVRAEMVLHGHEHQPTVTIARRWPAEIRREFQAVVAIGAGSVSAIKSNLGPFSRNQYFILYRKRDHLVVRSRCTGDTGLSFGSHEDLAIRLETACDGGVVPVNLDPVDRV